LHAEADRQRGQQLLERLGLFARQMQQGRAGLGVPDALVLGSRLFRPSRQDEQVKDEPPLEAGLFNDARIVQELSQVPPQRLGSGGIGSTELNQEYAGSLHARKWPVASG